MRRIWAVTVNTARQVLRMKIAVVFTVLLFVLLAGMSNVMTGDGTLKGKLQTFINYGFSLTNLLLCLFTIIVSTHSLTSEIKHGQVYTVLTKPIRRFQLLIGKLLGTVLLGAALLGLFTATIYSAVMYTHKFSGAQEPELIQVRNEFLTARASLVPEEIDVSKESLETYKKLQDSGQIPPKTETSKAAYNRRIYEITKQLKLQKRAATPGGELLWEFNNVKPLGTGQKLFVKFKYDVAENPPDLQILGRWIFGDYKQYSSKTRTAVYISDRKDLVRTFHEMTIPADAVTENGYLAIRFLNAPVNNTTVFFPEENGLEVLYKADTFTANFLRASLLLLPRLVLLACMGILASTFLSFPVAVLLCLFVFLTATISGFILESFKNPAGSTGWLQSYFFEPVIKLMPQFDKFDPVQYLVPARLLSWSMVAEAAVLMICIQAVLLLLIASFIFSYREVAKVTV